MERFKKMPYLFYLWSNSSLTVAVTVRSSRQPGRLVWKPIVIILDADDIDRSIDNHIRYWHSLGRYKGKKADGAANEGSSARYVMSRHVLFSYGDVCTYMRLF